MTKKQKLIFDEFPNVNWEEGAYSSSYYLSLNDGSFIAIRASGRIEFYFKKNCNYHTLTKGQLNKKLKLINFT